MSFEVVIACGGAGTRMSSINGNVPKILTPIYGKPFLDFILNRWKELECRRVHLLLGVGADEVWREVLVWMKKNQDDRMTISATIEPNPLGVIGALKFAESCLPEKFFFTYGDVYPTIDPQLLLNTISLADEGCLAVCRKDIAGEPPNIQLENGRIKKYKKNDVNMTYVDVGLMYLRKSALKVLDIHENRLLNEYELLGTLANDGKLVAFEHNAPSMHIGDPNAYSDFVRLIDKMIGII